MLGVRSSSQSRRPLCLEVGSREQGRGAPQSLGHNVSGHRVCTSGDSKTRHAGRESVYKPIKALGRGQDPTASAPTRIPQRGYITAWLCSQSSGLLPEDPRPCPSEGVDLRDGRVRCAEGGRGDGPAVLRRSDCSLGLTRTRAELCPPQHFPGPSEPMRPDFLQTQPPMSWLTGLR